MILNKKNFFCSFDHLFSENCSGSSKNNLLKCSLNFVSKKTFSCHPPTRTRTRDLRISAFLQSSALPTELSADVLSGDCSIIFHLKILFTRWIKQTKILMKFFHDSLRKKVLFCSYWSSVQTNSENCSGSSKNSLLKGSLVFVLKKTFSV